MKRILVLTTLITSIFCAQSVCAGDVKFPGQAAQTAFAQKFFDAKQQGGNYKYGVIADVFKGSEADKAMWRNLDKGLTPDGKKKLSKGMQKKIMEDFAAKQKQNAPKGFQGDPKDPGPQDWSDRIIETDGKGNVTGVKPRDWYDRDTDGDGEVSDEEQRVHDSKEQVENMDRDGDGNASLKEIKEAEKEMDTDGDKKVSDEEREAWNDKRKEERKNEPGSPGNVPPIADWDKDQDGKPDKGFKRSCWQCCPAQKKLNECHYGWSGDCTNGGSCSIAEICHYMPEVHDGVDYDCHQCEYDTDFIDPCAQYDLYSQASCNSECRPIDSCQTVHIDRNTGNRRLTSALRSDLVCYECGSDIEEEPKCTDGLLDGVCQGHDCKDDEKCKTVGDYCHVCLKEIPKCKDGFEYGECNEYACQSNQECVADGKCHKCKNKPIVEEKECAEGASADSSCGGICDLHESCEVTSQDPVCYSCVKDACYYSQYQSGSCPSPDPCEPEATCQSKTVSGKSCHYCQAKPPEQCPNGTFRDSSCSGTCDSNQECVLGGGGAFAPASGQTGTSSVYRDSPLECYVCRNKTEIQNQCDDGYSGGGCEPNPCYGGSQECFSRSGPCHICREKQCDAPYFNSAGCASCVEGGGKCWPMMTVASSVGNVPQCYQCDYPESCEKYGEASTCSMCRPGQLCIPGRTIVAGPPMSGEFQCKRCMNVKSIEVTYVIIIIETPHARYVLDEGSGFAGFNASQVMALAQVKSGGDAISSLSGMLGGGGLGMLMSAGTDLRSLGNLLSQGLDKGRKYSDDCFSKDFQEDPLPETPPASTDSDKNTKKKKKKKSKKNKEEVVATAPSGEFGEDTRRNMTTGGPVVACGQVDGEKALAVFDAAGKPVEMITKEALKRNPNAVMEALQKAESLNQTIMQIRQQGIEGFLKQKVMGFVEKMAKRMTKKVGQKIMSKSENKEKVIPNDPFYKEPAKKKKKKFLGILGSSKKAKIVIGSNIRMGSTALGAGSGGKKKVLVKDQWGLHRIGYTPLSDPDSAWHLVDFQNKNVVVAVIDSGFDFDHVDGAQYTWTNEDEIPNNGMDDDNNGYVDDDRGWNFLNNTNDLTDEKGHGSFVAGIIAAKWNNGAGIAGINPGAVIMPLKVADKEGETNSFNIFRAINYAVDNGAQVINVSLGSRGISEMERTALNYARARGVFVVVASGNVGESILGHGPAAIQSTFAVGSIDQEGTRSTISNWGPNNGVLAPGDDIMSLVATGTGRSLGKSVQKRGYYTQSGTSFSTPMVAATASLLLVQNPHLTPEDIEDILHRSAVEMYDEGWDGKSGAGLLNATAALRDDVSDRLTVKITETRINYDKKKRVESLDIFGTVRGEFQEFTVGLGKGKRADKFKSVAGPFIKQASGSWVAHLTKDEHLRGSQEWIVQIKALDQNGQSYTARTLVELE